MTDLIYKLSTIVASTALVASLGLGLCQGSSPSMSKASSGISKSSDSSSSADTEVISVGDHITIPVQVICANAGLNTIKDPYLREVASLTDQHGKPIFNCEQSNFLQWRGVEIDYIKDLLSLRDRTGNDFFTAADLLNYEDTGGTVEYAQQFANSSFSGKQLPQLFSLGLSLERLVLFKDTSKPNGLVVLPTKDQRTTFRYKDSIDLFKSLDQVYDLRVVVASRENEVYEALELSKGFHFALFGGHGTAANIALGEEEFSPEKEIYFIDTSDGELAHYLSFLHPRAVAFLYSCSTAQELNCESEKKCEGNLAQNFSFWAAGRYVLAAREDLSTAQVKVISYYPFNAILLNETGTRDITFRSSINSQ